MTLRYVEVTQTDLQREFHLARQRPRHLLSPPAPLSDSDPDRTDAAAILQRLSAAIRLLDLFRQKNSDQDKPLRLLLRRLVRVPSFLLEKLLPSATSEK
jgi:hypothetical protein